MINFLRKKVALVLMVLSLSFLMLSFSFAEEVFSDVDQGDWFYDEVMFVKEQALMNGVGEDKFAPRTNLSRAMFLTVLYRLSPDEGLEKTRFEDVLESDWFYKPVLWAEKLELIKGDENGLFNPKTNITREQMAVVIDRYLAKHDFSLFESDAVIVFEDMASCSNYAYDSIIHMRKLGIFKGDNNNMFYPKEYATRSEAAAVFMKLKTKIEGSSEEGEFDASTEEKELYVIPTVTELNVRNSVWGNPITYAELGKEYKVYEIISDNKGNNWYKINFNHGFGYIIANEKFTRKIYKDKVDVEVGDSASEEKEYLAPKEFNGDINFIMFPNQTVYSLGQVLKFDFINPSFENSIYYFQKYGLNGWETINIYDPKLVASMPYIKVETDRYRVLEMDKHDKNLFIEQEIQLSVVEKSVEILGLEDKIYPFDRIDFSLNATNINSPMFQVHISRDTKTVYFSDYSYDYNYSFIPEGEGDYLITVLARDANGNSASQIIASKNIIVGENGLVGFYTDVTNRSYMNAPVKCTAILDGEVTDFDWSYIYEGEEVAVDEEKNNKMFFFEPDLEGDYTIVLSACDSFGNEVQYTKNILFRRLSSDISITFSDSPNYYDTRFGFVPNIVVAHITEGRYMSAVNWLRNPVSEVSANFVVSRDGRVTQLLDIEKASWANGTAANPLKKTSYLKSKVDDVVDKKTNANFFTVTIEHEGIYKDTRGVLTPAQERSTSLVIQYIRNEIKRRYNKLFYFDRSTFVGHADINPITKPICPGEQYPFASIIDFINR